MHPSSLAVCVAVFKISFEWKQTKTNHYIREEADAADATLEQALEPPRDVVEDLDLALGQWLASFRGKWSSGVEVFPHR